MAKVQELYVRMLVALQSAQKGQGLVEYALIIALVSVVLMAALATMSGGITEVFGEINTALTGARP